MNLKPEERQKVSTPNGSWFCNIDKNQIAYVLLTNPNYPERHAYGMIRVLKYKYLNNIFFMSRNATVKLRKYQITLPKVMSQYQQKQKHFYLI